LGNGSITVPSTSIASSLLILIGAPRYWLVFKGFYNTYNQLELQVLLHYNQF